MTPQKTAIRYVDAVLKRKLIVEERGIYEGSGRCKTSY